MRKSLLGVMVVAIGSIFMPLMADAHHWEDRDEWREWRDEEVEHCPWRRRWDRTEYVQEPAYIYAPQPVYPAPPAPLVYYPPQPFANVYIEW